MHPYEVIFTQGPNSAMDDLADLDQTIQVVVLQRSRSVLRSEGTEGDDDLQHLHFPAGYKIRRAISKEEALRLRNSEDVEPTDTTQAHDVWYVFRDFNPMEIGIHGGQDGYVVERLITTSQYAFLLLHGWSLEPTLE